MACRHFEQSPREGTLTTTELRSHPIMVLSLHKGRGGLDLRVIKQAYSHFFGFRNFHKKRKQVDPLTLGRAGFLPSGKCEELLDESPFARISIGVAASNLILHIEAALAVTHRC